MNTQVPNDGSPNSVAAQVVDLSDMSCFEAKAYKLAEDGCWIISDKVDLLKDEIGLRLPGQSKLIRGTVVAFGDNEARISFVQNSKIPKERRRESRRQVLISAIVSGQNTAQTMKCKIVDASKSGCRLESEKISRLPDEVEISIPGLDVPITGDIVWRSVNQAGVRFSWPNGVKPKAASDESPAKPQDKKPMRTAHRKRVSAFGD